MATNKELRERVAKLEQQLEQPPVVDTFTLVYGPRGILGISTTSDGTPESLQLLKLALSMAVQNVDSMWVAAVQRQAPPIENGETGPEKGKDP